VLLDANKVITLNRETNMSELRKYVNRRIQSDPDFADNFFEGYESFKVGVLLRQGREAAGLTQEDMARQLRMPRSTISKVENHTEEVRLSLIKQYADALGKSLYISIA
jgi:DNA-binding XRE family transcriptional regulator